MHDRQLADKIQAAVTLLYKKNMEAKDGFKLISPVVESLINHYYTFFIAPDGSKEGYDLSDDSDVIRKKTIDLLQELKDTNGEHAVNFVEISYGDDDNNAVILNKG